MTSAEAVWAIVPLVAALTALTLFSRKRRRTDDFVEMKAVKARVPWWVRPVEMLMALAFGFALATATFKIYGRGAIRSPQNMADASAIYVAIGIGSIILPIALLCANGVSWIVPTLRNANESAFRDTDASFKTANLGLIKFASVSVPLGLLALSIAAIEPWTR